MIHPADVFTDMWEQKQRRLTPSFLILFILFFAKILERQTTGFAFNYNNLDKLNVVMIFLQVFGLFLLWAVVNWAISTLFEGKAKMREIWIFSSAALLPYIISILFSVILSNVFVPDEGMFISWILYIGIGWSALMLCISLMIIHDYTLGKVIWSTLLTLAGMVLLVFVVVLMFSLFQQIYGFIQDFISEIIYMISFE